MSKGNKSGTAQPVQPKTATADTNNVVAPNNPGDQAVEIETPAEQMELPNAPQANMPQATEVPVSDNGMMKLLNRHGQPVELPEKTALFLLKRYPRWYTQIN